jgi:hypothetical protein
MSKMLVLTVDKIDAETDKAIGIKDTKGILQYFPKSQIEIVHGKREIAIHVPEWLAEQKDNLEFEDY